ncbi:MAG: hypothetical protein HAW67_01970 [Endozoicomonadaceae bacterium]|nr:hypothetical protein [Endozoicomonadaceae bacterium]
MKQLHELAQYFFKTHPDLLPVTESKSKKLKYSSGKLIGLDSCLCDYPHYQRLFSKAEIAADRSLQLEDVCISPK